MMPALRNLSTRDRTRSVSDALAHFGDNRRVLQLVKACLNISLKHPVIGSGAQRSPVHRGAPASRKAKRSNW